MGRGCKSVSIMVRRNNIYNTWYITKWLWYTAKKFRLQAGINIILGCSSVFLDFAFIWATKMAIDIATKQQSGTLQTAAFLLIGIMAFQILTGFFGKWVRAILGVYAQNTMQQRIFSQLLESDWTCLEKKHTGDMLNRLEKDVTEVVLVLTETIPSILAVSVRLVGGFLFLYAMDSFLACAIILILPFCILLSKIYVKKMRHLTRKIRHTDSIIQSVLQETLQHKIVIKTLEQTGFMAGRLGEVQSSLRRQVKRRTAFSSFSSTMLNIGFGSCYLIAFLWGSSQLYHGNITYGMMIAFVQLVGQIQSPFRDMTRFIPVLINSLTASERLIELEELPKEPQGIPVRMNGKAGICFNDVEFTYSDGHRSILSGFSHDFTPGSSTAILGETGSGKTTLIRLILGLITPDKGFVRIYDRNKAVACSSLTRCNIIYVPQGNSLFSGSIRDNLLLGNPKATEEEIKKALKIACAEFIFDLPEGIETRCKEMGVGFSEGQAQRIAIARALLRKGSILLLDEATSALDAKTERQLLSNLQEYVKDKTILFVTHREEVVNYCDQVVKINRISNPSQTSTH